MFYHSTPGSTPGNNTKMIHKIFVYFVLFCLFANASHGCNDSSYEFKIRSINKKKYLFGIIYQNKSKIAHCLRIEDFELDLTGDSLYVFFENGLLAKFIGKNRPIDNEPKEFIILPPGEEARGAIYLNKYYKIKNESVIVSYSVPVIPCTDLMQQYVKIPPTEFLKDKINDPNNVKTDVFSEDYPIWAREGFIAITNRLLVKR